MERDLDLGRLLGERTLALVDIPSVSRNEARIAAAIEAAVPRGVFHERYADSDGLFFLTDREPGRPLVVLAGHLDTVPAQENLPGTIEEGWVVGLGASDMKGGLAVMIELAAWLERERPERSVDVGILFFSREELPASESPLPVIFAACPELRAADLVIVLEPTDNTIQAGCLGNLNATLTFRGESAHSARPWLGVNAITLALEGLRPIAQLPPNPVEIDGLRFVEVLSPTWIRGGVADNVIPAEVVVGLNFRFAPDRTVAEAETRLEELVGTVGELSIEGRSPAGSVAAHSPLVQRLRHLGGFAVEPKQAWTPVAQFTEEGVDAVNLGPGATHYAHKRDERVSILELVRTFRALQRFVVDEA